MLVLSPQICLLQVADFLRDDEVREWSVDALARLFRAEIEPLWSDVNLEQRINADMRPSTLIVCEVCGT